VNDWSPVFLGIIAVATLVMAVIQVGAIVVMARLGLQVQRVLTSVQQDIPPLITRANAIADEASKTAALATAQAEKIDRLVTDLVKRVDETSAIVQEAVVRPAREGLAILAALKAGLSALRGVRDFRGRPAGSEDEDALFIG
jgi:Holliday junction resolvasome RuvABC ATP-dependent DNA helicase subunit